uniref:Uncharacterized protein n=1 Tax=Oryza barthii TaxID=65489 RepID=A0A0D3HH99_9ORYZ
MSDYRSHLWGFTANEKEAYSGENDERQQILQIPIWDFMVPGLEGDTGSAFVNGGVLKEIRDWVNAKRDTPLGEDEATTHMENTCHAIHDYLKLYFPAYRPQIAGKVRGHQVSRVWELGERLGKDGGRCLACHERVKGFNVTKLQNHLQGSVKRQGIQCPAINNYILSRLERILKEMNEDQ